jgi:hypothetical protein
VGHKQFDLYLEEELKASRKETGKIKLYCAAIVNLNDWAKPKNSKSGSCRFFADDASQVQMKKQTQCTGNIHNGRWS